MKVTRVLNLKQHKVNSMGSNQDPLKVNEKPEYNFERKKKPINNGFKLKIKHFNLEGNIENSKIKIWILKKTWKTFWKFVKK